jgi:hypothetical protein
MRHHLFTLGCFGAAMPLYVLGAQQHAGLLILAGALSELLGWKRLLSRKQRS